MGRKAESAPQLILQPHISGGKLRVVMQWTIATASRSFFCGHLYEFSFGGFSRPGKVQLVSFSVVTFSGSKGAALFCRLKAIRANCDDEVVDDLLYIFDNSFTHIIGDRLLILEQLRKIKRRMCNPDVKDYEKKLNLLVDALEEMIYGNTKPKDIEEIKII